MTQKEITLQDLPEHLLVEIFSFLSIHQVSRLQRLSKSFQKVFKSCPLVIYNFLRVRYQSPFFPKNTFPVYHELKRICPRLAQVKVGMLQVLAYFTDGGISNDNSLDSMMTIFSSNFFNSCYSTKTSKNVLVKAVFCGGNLKYSSLRNEWQRKAIDGLENRNSLQINLYHLRKNLEKVLQNQCKDVVITSFKIQKPSRAYKAPLRTFMIFSSQQYEQNDQVVKLFYDCEELDQAMQIADLSGFEYQIEENSEEAVMRFCKSKERLRPLLWVSFKKIYITCEILEVELMNQKVGSYIYILLINSFDPYQRKIDVGSFIPKGKILSFRI